MTRADDGRVDILRLILGDWALIFVISLSIASGLLAILVDSLWMAMVIPILVVGAHLVLLTPHFLLRLLFFSIPLSMEVALSGGLSTDLVGEPILWILLGITILTILLQGLRRELFSWVSFILFCHMAWIFFTCFFASNQVISLKYALAKMWYIFPFYILPFYLVKDLPEVRVLLKCFLAGLLCASIYFFVQHLQLDLSYMSRTNAGQPIWRNHVNYACTLVVSIPIAWFLFKTSKHPDRWFYYLVIGLILTFIYYAYARIAYLCLIIGLAYYIILKLRATALSILISVALVVITIITFSINNKYLHLAPDFDKTIMQRDFGHKIAATTSGEDISTMERVHRWVAGSRMIRDRPWTGFGPANFYSSYRPYTVYSFETYVSDNPERSGIHNYYLMVLVEQGYIGLAIFLGLIIATLLKLETKYHETKEPALRQLLVMVGTIILMITTINAVNDMIEVIKIGGLFFFTLFLLSQKWDVVTTLKQSSQSVVHSPDI